MKKRSIPWIFAKRHKKQSLKFIHFAGYENRNIMILVLEPLQIIGMLTMILKRFFLVFKF